MPTHRQGLDQRSDIQPDIVRDLVHRVLWHYDMLGETATPAAESNEAILIAAIDKAVLTGAALSVIDDRLYAHSITAGKALAYAFADIFNDPAKLMSEGQGYRLPSDRVWRSRTKGGPSDVLMEV